MNKLKKLYLYLRAIPKTVYFNLKYFSLKEAIKFPVIISHRVYLMEVKGKVEIQGEIHTAMIKIGFGQVGIFDNNKSRSIWEVTGKVIFKGNANVGHGSKISCSGELILGKNFNINAESSIICCKKIKFGDNNVLSWNILIMDTDFHKIFDENGHLINQDKDINIGSNVWIGCRCLILKGSLIRDNCVVGASTFLSKPINQENVIIGGNPAKIINQNITWEK